jgi:O-antigen/teichoic acid export membrane protein
MHNFTDKWLLQNYGGSVQQGYLQIANQFATVSLLATTSILSVFWKEIAHAWEIKDLVRVERLYRKVSRGLVMIGAIISGLLIPWAEQIVTIALGAQYAQAWPVLALMLLYPIHQSMGQIGGTMFLARGQTKIHMYLIAGTILVSMPISYILLAPVTDFGLAMGAMGIAVKNVLLGVISVNIQAWIIARTSGWKFDWVFQVVGISLMIMIGYSVKFLVGQIWDLSGITLINLIKPALLDCILYATLVLWLAWMQPWLLGLEREEVGDMIRSFRVRVKLILAGAGVP